MKLRSYWLESFAPIFKFLIHIPTISIISLLLYYSNRSIDFSDESLYLYLTSNPTEESTLAGVWNWYLNLLYRMSGEDIVLYRQISVVMAFACAFFFAWAYFSISSNKKNVKLDIRRSLFPIVLTTISVVFFYRSALITPGYNWLALIAVLLSMAGAVKWLSGERTLIWPVTSAVGLGLATMARPFAGIIIFLAMLSYQKIRIDIFRLTILGKVFFITIVAFVIFHQLFLISLTDTVKAFLQTYLVSQGDESHSFINLLSQSGADIVNLPLNAISISKGLILIPVFFIFLNLVTKTKQSQITIQTTLVLGSLAGFAALLTMNQLIISSPESKNEIGLTLATLTLFGFLCAVSLRTNVSEVKSGPYTEAEYKHSASATKLLLAGIFGFAFSSNNGLLNQSAGIGILYVALYLRSFLDIGQQKLAQKILVFNVIFLVVVSSQVLYGAWQNPYRSVNLSENVYPVTVGEKSTILVSKSRAEDISNVKAIAKEIDAKKRNLYLVDLSPFTTYIPYELEFKTIETPAIFESNYLEGFVQRNKDLLQEAWILTSDSEKSIDPENLVRLLGKTIEQDYEVAYALNGDFCRNLPCRLTLWKPVKLE